MIAVMKRIINAIATTPPDCLLLLALAVVVAARWI